MAAMLGIRIEGKGLKLADLPEFDPSVFAGRSWRNAHPEKGSAVYQGLADVPLLQRTDLFDRRAEIGRLAGV